MRRWRGKRKPRFWFKEKPGQPQQESEERKDDHPVREETVEESGTEEAGGESVTEDGPVTEDPVQVMSEDDSKETETAHQMWLSEKVTSLETENRELKKALQEMETMLTLQEAASRQIEERCARLGNAITQVAEFVQQQNASIESSRASLSSLVEEVNTHRANFQKVGMIMQVHEQYICGVAL